MDWKKLLRNSTRTSLVVGAWSSRQKDVQGPNIVVVTASNLCMYMEAWYRFGQKMLVLEHIHGLGEQKLVDLVFSTTEKERRGSFENSSQGQGKTSHLTLR